MLTKKVNKIKHIGTQAKVQVFSLSNLLTLSFIVREGTCYFSPSKKKRIKENITIINISQNRMLMETELLVLSYPISKIKKK